MVHSMYAANLCTARVADFFQSFRIIYTAGQTMSVWTSSEIRRPQRKEKRLLDNPGSYANLFSNFYVLKLSADMYWPRAILDFNICVAGAHRVPFSLVQASVW